MTVIVQAGHLHIENHCTAELRAASGALGESGWAEAVAAMVVERLNGRSVVARATDANFTCSDEVAQDYQAVIALHYQANMPTESGFFVGTGDANEDASADASTQLAQAIRVAYEQRTGLVYQPGWNNLGITHHYVFESLSPATPFCLLECGVGWGPDRDLLHSRNGMMLVAEAVAQGLAAFVSQAAAPVALSLARPSTRDHGVDILRPNVQLHKEPTDPNAALHAIALELSEVRLNRDAAETDVKNTARVLTNLAQLIEARRG